MKIEIHKGYLTWAAKSGKLHREDGPAIVYSNGSKSWWVDGQLHREDGPAIERSRGTKKWYINGKCLTEGQFNRRKSED